jgi:glycosyltransferase involved in cell wall biosynthesis
MSRVVIFSGPYPVDDGLGGVGIRLWETAQLLADAGHSVTLVVPRPSDFTHPGVRFVEFSEDSWRAQVEGHDVVLTTDLPDTRILLHAHTTGARMIVENAPPIEHLHYDRLRDPEHGRQLYLDLLARYRLQLLLADHLLVRSRAEQLTTLGALVATGRMVGVHDEHEPAARRFMSLLPVGFTAHAARAAAAAGPQGDPVDLVWNGGIWNYCSPEPVFDAMAAAKAAGHRLTLRLMYRTGQDTTRRLQQHLSSLGVSDQVQWPLGCTGHRRRDGYMKTARAMVIAGRDTAENLTCHRLRVRDAALYEMPVIVDHYGATGQLVTASGIGAAVDPADVDSLAAALVAATQDGQARIRFAAALRDHRPRFELERYIGNVLAFLDSDRRAPDAGKAGQLTAIDDLVGSYPLLGHPPPAVV